MFDGVYTDLSLQKSADDYTPEFGQEVTWTITVSNEGPAWAENVRVDDMLPEGMELVSSHLTGGGLDVNSGTWSLGGLGVGEVATATITMKVTEVDDYINNYAKVSTDTHDWNGYNDGKSAVAVDPWQPTDADLSLVKTVDNPNPEVGSVVEWTVTVSNTGPDTAWGTRVNEQLPEGLGFVGARASSGTYDFQSGVWHVGHLESGETAEMIISTSVDSEAGAQYVNTAVAASNTVDSDTSNNTAQASITVVEAAVEPVWETPSMPPVDKPEGGKPEGGSPEGGKPDGGMGHSGMGHPVACCCYCDKEEETGADLQIVKLVSNATPNLNSEVVWSLVVTNLGPEDAVNVIVNDNLPPGVEYVSDSATMGAFDVDAGVWEIGDLANGESALLQITTIATDAAAVQTNIALVSSDTEDSNPANDVAVVSIDAVNADLAITKTPDEQTPDLGAEFDWTITVVNNGPDTAENVVVNDMLPPDTEFVASDDERFVLSDDGTSGSIALGDLASGEEVSFNITAIVTNAAGPRTNTAQVSSDTFDDNPDNNQDDAQVDAIAADLELVKGVLPATAAPQDIVEWTIEVTNKGPDDATGVEVEDVLPAGVSYVSDSTDGVSFDSATGIWSVGDLASGDTVSLTIQALVVDTGELTNVAQIVAADQFDPDSTPGNDDGDQSEDDEDNAVLVVPEIIDLALTQEISSATADVGGPVTFTIAVTNESTVPASGVSVATQLPGHFASGDLTFVDSSDPSVVGDPAANIIIGDLAPGQTVTVTVDATVNTPGVIENVAQVFTADQMDVDSTPANNIETEDDQQTVSVTVVDPNPVPVANDDQFAVSANSEGFNAVIMIDHSGSTGSVTAVDANGDPLDQSGSPLAMDILDANGNVTSRLQLIREAVVEFVGQEAIGAVKILGFDGSAGGAGDVSVWTDVSGANPDVTPVMSFVGDFEASGFTNYIDALDASQNFLEQAIDANGQTIADPLPNTLPVNYYFLTDGNPLAPNFSAADATPDAAQQAAWEEFVEANFNDAYGIGYGSGVTEISALDIVSHPDTPAAGPVSADDNTILTSEADGIPADLFRTIAESVSGNVFGNDDSGLDGPQLGASSVSTVDVDGVVYGYDGSSVTVTGTAPATSLVRPDFINVPVSSGGRLEFNFQDGSFEYFAPLTTVAFTDTFDYTITDSSGDSDTATLSIDVLPGATTAAEPAPALALLSDDDEVFSSDSMAAVQLPALTDNEWAGDGVSHGVDLFDMTSLIV